MGSSSAAKSFSAPLPFSQFTPSIVSPVQPAPVITPQQNPPPVALLNDPGTTIQGASQPSTTNQNQFSDVQSRLAALRQSRGMGNRPGPMPFLGY